MFGLMAGGSQKERQEGAVVRPLLRQEGSLGLRLMAAAAVSHRVNVVDSSSNNIKPKRRGANFLVNFFFPMC